MIGHKIHHYFELISTNLTAFELARGGAGEGEVVVADVQTGGRGRAGHSWESPAGNIYMSVILRPPLPLGERAGVRGGVASLTLLAGVAVAEALDKFTKGEPMIKWPNDIWIGGKKVCGILAERGDDFVVIGIGINVNSRISDFSPDVQKTATSLNVVQAFRPAKSAGLKTCATSVAGLRTCATITLDCDKIIKAVCHELDRWYDIWKSSGFAPIKDRYGFWSLLDGKVVDVTFGDETLHGMVHSIDDDGALLLQTEEGELERVVAGDVVVRSA